MRLLLAVFILCLCCNHGQAQQANAIDIKVDLQKTFQTIENFGASDAWSCQFVGNWPDAAKNKMADWLFSMDTLDNGNPKGIGLSLWRFNFGAGSREQGDSSGIRDEWRRASSFLEKKGVYNWQQQKAQLWFLHAAKQRGVKLFLGFFNSPPVEFTRNKKAFAHKGVCNIAPDQYRAFAVYAARTLKHIKQQEGITFNYLSPVNEPQWDWSDGGQEGSPYTNREISELAKTFDTVLQENMVSAKLIIPESGQLQYLLNSRDHMLKNNQVAAFFNDSSAGFVGHLPSVEPVVASHSYFTSSPYPTAMRIRDNISRKVAEMKGLRYWQTEYSVLGDNAGEINGRGRDTGMATALYVAKVIHADLVAGNAAAWQWWLAISPYDYKDGLIYIDKNKEAGCYYDSKTLWALGNYSRFVRPGMQRVAVNVSGTDSLLVSAYKDGINHKLVFIIINATAKEQKLRFIDQNSRSIFTKQDWVTYTTSASQQLEKKRYPSESVIRVLPGSIVTLESSYKGSFFRF